MKTPTFVRIALAALVATSMTALMSAQSSTGAEKATTASSLIADQSGKTLNAIQGMNIDTIGPVIAQIDATRREVADILADLRKQTLKTAPKVQTQLVELMAKVDGAGDDLEHDIYRLKQADAGRIVSMRDQIAADFQTYVAYASRAQARDLELQ